MESSDAVRVGEIDGMYSFLQNIDWTEPWLIALLVCHLLCLVFTIVTRKHANIQAILFLLLLFLIFMSEWINEYAASNYKLFSRLQYFDSSGLFIAVVFSLPLLCNCLLMVMIWVYQMAHLLVKVKRAEIRHKLKSEEAKDK
ncbi:transmembrane protein 18-like [Asterias rubens]|uniref:transmembrane protein 18-like n=1 Tax=Asterias rubens TaxID=7604 RepID=UPI001454EAD5|nr:transmembrane protein 18-like [Asterias rubens]